MTPKEIATRLVAAQGALNEKLGALPWTDMKLDVQHDGRCHISVYGILAVHETKAIRHVYGESFSETLDAVDRFIEAMPDPELAQKHKWHKKLADVIDEGHALSLPDEVMNPLRTGSQAMTENLLTDQRAAQ